MRKLFILVISLALFARVLWISEPLLAPFSVSADAPNRRCASADFSVSIDTAVAITGVMSAPTPAAEAGGLLGLGVQAPLDSDVVAESVMFAYPPESSTPGLSLREIVSPGCRWLLGVVPAATSRAELRRFAVALRQRTLPVVVLSGLVSPAFSLQTGVLARAGFLMFPELSEVFRYPRVLVNYGAKASNTERGGRVISWGVEP